MKNIYSPHGNLGDNLWITPACKFVPINVSLYDEPFSRSISRIYDNIAEVSFINSQKQNFIYDRYEHKTIQWLKYIGIDYQDKNIIPEIKLTKEEELFGVEYIKNIPNPIIVKNENSGTWDAKNTRAHYVCPDEREMQSIVDDLIRQGKTPMQFGLNDNFFGLGETHLRPLKGTIQTKGLTVRQLASIYKAVGYYIGGDTGDYHLMLSVGGLAEVLIPEQSEQFGYIYYNLFYRPDMFGKDPIRVQYLTV